MTSNTVALALGSSRRPVKAPRIPAPLRDLRRLSRASASIADLRSAIGVYGCLERVRWVLEPVICGGASRSPKPQDHRADRGERRVGQKFGS